MTAITKPDLVSKGMDRLPSFWDDKPKARGLLRSFLQAFQNPLDLLFEILNGTSLSDAVGIQLDIIGKLWVTPRSGLNDSDYRIEIFKTIARATVDSTPERVYEVMQLASNASKLRLTEYSPDVYLYLNNEILESLTGLADSVVAAGVDIRLVFPPFEAFKDGSGVPAFDLSFGHPYSLLEASWTNVSTGSKSNTLSTLSGVTDDLTIVDTGVASSLYTTQTVGVSLSTLGGYTCSTFIKKDATAPIVLLDMLFSGINPWQAQISVDPSDGSFLLDNILMVSLSAEVLDVGDYYFIVVTMFTPIGELITALELNVYPSYGTVLGTQDVTTTGTNVINQSTVRQLTTQKYEFIQEENTGLSFSDVAAETFDLVDSVGDNIVDDTGDLLQVETGQTYLGTALPLNEVLNIVYGQPLTEVI